MVERWLEARQRGKVRLRRGGGGNPGMAMARPGRLESRDSSRVVAGFMSVTLHVGLCILIVLAGGRQDGVDEGDTPISQLVMLERVEGGRRDEAELGLLKPAVLAASFREPLSLQTIDPPPLLLPEPEAQSDDADGTPQVEVAVPSDTTWTSAVDPLSTLVVMQRPEASALLKRVQRIARKKLATKPHARATWTQDGKQYDARLVLERPASGVEPDRVVAEISTEEQGRRLTTWITLKRLSFAHFTQIVDRWDPQVQLHDDEIVGRMHINSKFNVLADSQARPALLGKVSTSAGSFDLQSIGRGHESDVFREGIETDAGRITLSDLVHPLAWAESDSNARIHALANDTRIRFLGDGGYRWIDSQSGALQHRDEPSGQSVYFIAAPGVTLYVQGVVAGKFLVYSPQRIVVEGSLTYAHDPRDVQDSGDYLGLVCDKNIELAAPDVTGPGDIDIQAALYAGRRFVVTNFLYSRSATLRIYGSLAAGSLSASEPRYAKRVEFDRRFERARPPGFPSTNRYAAEEWDRQWIEVPIPAASADLGPTASDYGGAIQPAE
jgi:hypothetical protein